MKHTYEPIFKGAACSCVNKARKRRLGGHCKAEMGGTYGLKRGSLCLCWTLKWAGPGVYLWSPGFSSCSSLPPCFRSLLTYFLCNSPLLCNASCIVSLFQLPVFAVAIFSMFLSSQLSFWSLSHRHLLWQFRFHQHLLDFLHAACHFYMSDNIDTLVSGHRASKWHHLWVNISTVLWLLYFSIFLHLKWIYSGILLILQIILFQYISTQSVLLVITNG